MSGSARLETSLQVAYLLPHADSFWRWSDDGESVVWRSGGGKTIAFRKEIWTILGRLAPHAVPPFSSLILLLAATRESWDDPNAIVERILAIYADRGHSFIMTVVNHKVRQEVAGVVDDLATVAALPPHLKQTTIARGLLAEFVFGVARPTMDETAGARLLDLLDQGVDPQLLQQSIGQDSDFSRLSAELDALRPGLARLAAEPLENWSKTGLEQPIEPAKDLDLPHVQRVRALLRDLRSDPQLAGIARLARDVLAALHVPRALAMPEEIPVGGVSDISNRGPLDRLLVSELAHDDLTLAVRVALNEALYLRRESPAKHPPFSRAILIDVGIRLWGVPRLFAAAVGLALAATADERAPVRSFRTAGRDAREVALTSRDGLTALLEALEPDPHPGPSLESFLHFGEGNGETDVETFVVTHEAAFADLEFANALRAATDGGREWYVATVAGDGTLVLWRVGLAGRQEICRATLSLDEIAPDDSSAQKKPTGPSINKRLLARDPNLPHILATEPFPLLLPAQIIPRNAAVSIRTGLVAVTSDRRLMRWTRSTAGGEQLHACLPPGKVEGVFADELRDAAHVVVARHKHNAIDILRFDLANPGRFDHREFPRNHPQRVFFYAGSICLAYKHEVRVIDPDTWSERVVKLPAAARWCGIGRFLYVRGKLQAFTPDGFHDLGDWPPQSQPFDRAALGASFLRSDGTIAMPDVLITPDRPTPRPHFFLVATSPDGNRIVAAGTERGHKTMYVVDLADGPKAAWRRAPAPKDDPHAHAALLGPALNWAYPLTIRRRFDGIFADEGGMLTLTRGPQLSIRLDGDELKLRGLVSPDQNRLGPGLRPFVLVSSASNSHFTLKCATWNDGSKAFLDSRGLLHLVSSDRKLPQLTLVLTDHPLAGWTTDGRTFGWAYFLPQRATDAPALGAALIREFVGRLH